MKLHLLHGPAINSSRLYLNNFRKRFDSNDVVVFEKGAPQDVIKASYQTDSLFSKQKLIIIENSIEDILDDNITDSDVTLVFWFDYKLSEKSTILKLIQNKKGQIHFFPEEKEISVFPFLDQLSAGNKRVYFELDKLTKAGFDNQYLITMIFYLLRSLLYTPKKASDFVKKKNARVRVNFQLEKVTSLYRFVLETDFKIKSGLIDSKQAQFRIINQFLSTD